MSRLVIDERGIIVACGSCGQTNRLAFEGLSRTSRCGRCKRALGAPAEPLDVSSTADFDRVVMKASVPVVVDYWTTSSSSDHVAEAELAEIAGRANGRWLVLRVNTDASAGLSEGFGNGSFPALALFAGGRELGRTRRKETATDLEAFIQRTLTDSQTAAPRGSATPEIVDLTNHIYVRRLLRKLGVVPLVAAGTSLMFLYLHYGSLLYGLSPMFPSGEVPSVLGVITLGLGWVAVRTTRGVKAATWISMAQASLLLAAIVYGCLGTLWDVVAGHEAITTLGEVAGGSGVLAFWLWRVVPDPRPLLKYCRDGSPKSFFVDRDRPRDTRDLPRQNLLQLVRVVGWRSAGRSLTSMLPHAVGATVLGAVAFLTIRAGLWQLALGGAWVVVECIRRGWRRARPHLVRTAVQTQSEDQRRPILLLRSFQDDEIWLTPPNSMWRSVVPYLGPRRLEEVLAEELWGLGPVLAIGRPGEVLPLLGAARDYLADDRWQDRVQDLVREAAVVVVIMGSSDGLRWEYETLARAGALNKVLLVVPPASEAALEKSWHRAQAAFGRAFDLGAVNPATHFIVPGRLAPRAVVSGYRDVESYRLALATAFDRWHSGRVHPASAAWAN